MMDNACQLIHRDGTFNVIGAQQFFKKFKAEQCGLSVVSIIGAQCSGKSTLLNHLFGTNFRELDASKGRFGTTEGIWVARCADIEPCTIVIDIEGTDGRERGEEDTVFEKQSALFAFAISDIVIINMYCHDIGQHEAAGVPLLKIVFKAMMHLFSPGKTSLMFVIRDKSRTPLENLESVLRKQIQKTWDSNIKPEEHIKTLLNEFFNIEVVALSSYEDKKEQFKVEVASLRQRFIHSVVPSRLASDRRGVVSANAFALSAEQKWQTIKNYQDLNLPPYRVMVAAVRCDELVNEKVSHFMENEDWLQLSREVARSAHVTGFGKRLSSILRSSLSEFDIESRYYDKDVKFSKRQELQNNLLHIVQPIFKNAIENLRLRAFENFKDTFGKALNSSKGLASSAHSYVESCMSQFDKDCQEFVIKEANWDTSKTREKLEHDIQSYTHFGRIANLSKLTALYESKLNKALDGPVESLLEIANDATWPFIRKLVTRETKLAFHGCSNALSGFDIDEKTEKKMLSDFEKYAHDLVEAKVRKESAHVLRHMKNRFAEIFNYDSDSFPRCWTKMEDIKEITKMARFASLKVLSVLAVIRLDDKDDNVETILSLALINSTNMESLALNTWEEVTPTKTLITPLQCISIWSRFKNETEYLVTNAISTQQAEERDNNCICPSWIRDLFLN